MTSPLSLVSRPNNSSALKHSSQDLSSKLFSSFVAPLWMCSSNSMSFCSGVVRTKNHIQKCGLSSANCTDHLPSDIVADTGQDAVGYLGQLSILLAHVQLAIDQHSQVIFYWATFQGQSIASHLWHMQNWPWPTDPSCPDDSADFSYHHSHKLWCHVQCLIM